MKKRRLTFFIVIVIITLLTTLASGIFSFPMPDAEIEPEDVSEMQLYFASPDFETVVITDSHEIERMIHEINQSSFGGISLPSIGVGGTPLYSIDFLMADGSQEHIEIVSKGVGNSESERRVVAVASNTNILPEYFKHCYMSSDVCNLFWELCCKHSPTEANLEAQAIFQEGWF